MRPCFMSKRPPRRGNCPARRAQTHWRGRIYQLLLPTKELEAMLMNELNKFNAEQDKEAA